MQVKVIIMNYRLLIFYPDDFPGLLIAISRQTQAHFLFVFVDDLDEIAFLEFADDTRYPHWQQTVSLVGQ